GPPSRLPSFPTTTLFRSGTVSTAVGSRCWKDAPGWRGAPPRTCVKASPASFPSPRPRTCALNSPDRSLPRCSPDLDLVDDVVDQVGAVVRLADLQVHRGGSAGLVHGGAAEGTVRGALRPLRGLALPRAGAQGTLDGGVASAPVGVAESGQVVDPGQDGGEDPVGVLLVGVPVLSVGGGQQPGFRACLGAQGWSLQVHLEFVATVKRYTDAQVVGGAVDGGQGKTRVARGGGERQYGDEEYGGQGDDTAPRHPVAIPPGVALGEQVRCHPDRPHPVGEGFGVRRSAFPVSRKCLHDECIERRRQSWPDPARGSFRRRTRRWLPGEEFVG